MTGVLLFLVFASLGIIQETLAAGNKTFYFSANHTFKILQITDTHYGEDEVKDFHTSNVVSDLIKRSNPDLVAITGDAISGYAWNGRDSGFQYNNWAKWTSPYMINKQYYAYTLGNHDAEGDLNRTQVYLLDHEHPYSMTGRSFNITGISNYIIPIYSSLADNRTSMLLWFLDTNREGCEGVKLTWGCLEDDQIGWYNKTSQEMIDQHNTTNGLAFFHIPLLEYIDLWQHGENIYGDKYEEVACPRVNTYWFRTMKARGNIQAMFCGHDHNNYYGGWLDGIEMVYGRKTGYGGYGPPDGVQRGARLITLTESMDGTGKITVQRTHVTYQEDGTIEENLPPKTPRNDGQVLCSLPIRIVDYVRLSLMIVLSLALIATGGIGIFIMYKHRSNSKAARFTSALND